MQSGVAEMTNNLSGQDIRRPCTNSSLVVHAKRPQGSRGMQVWDVTKVACSRQATARWEEGELVSWEACEEEQSHLSLTGH